MAIKYSKQYTNQSEYLYDIAKSTGLLDEDTYNALASSYKADDYASAVANTKYTTSDTFDRATYDLLSGEAQYNYLLREYYMDKNSQEYKDSQEYFDYEIQKAVDAKTFDSLNGFEKTVATVGGILGNALNELVLGTVEGVLDVFGLAVGYLIEQPGVIGYGATALGDENISKNLAWRKEAGEAIKDWVGQDTTGVRRIREDLARFSRAYTYIDKNAFAKGVNDVATGMAKMVPLLLNIPAPGLGTFVYFSGMAGNVAEEAIIANPDIDYGSLVAYTALVTGAEFAIEKISAKAFGGSAIDNFIFKTSSSKGGSWIARIGLDFLSEGLEESIAEFADSVLYTVLVDQNAPIASVKDILYAGLIGGIIGGIGAGGKIVTTSNVGISKEGTLVDFKNLTKAERKAFDGKKLGKAQSLTLKERIANVKNALDTNAITDLRAKYKKLSLEDIKTKHSEEYQEALETNIENRNNLNEAALGLAKILELIGEENFIKATELANYTAEQTQEAVNNYLNRTSSTNQQNKRVEDLYALKNPGSSLKVSENLTTEQQRLKDGIKRMYNKDVFFGDLGFDGLKKRNGLTLDEKTIVIDNAVFDKMSLETVINEVVKEELVHALQYEGYILDAKTIQDLNEQYKTLDGKISTVKGKQEYKSKNVLTQISENQAKFLAESLLFDKLTVSRIFITNNSTFSKIYKWLNSRKTAIEDLKNRKTNKDKVEYRLLLKTMDMYRKAAASRIGNVEDTRALASELSLTDEQAQNLIDMFVPDHTNQHYTLLGKNYTIHTERRMSAEKDLSNARKLINRMLPLSYRNIYNPEYYENEFVKAIVSRNPNEDFRYNLQEYMITTHGFTINEVDGCLMEIVDYDKITTKEFNNDLSDLIANPNALEKYKTADQIFRPTFKNKFGNELTNIDIKIIKTNTQQNKRADYVRKDPITGRATIKVYIKETSMYTPSQIDVLRHSIYHEMTHALADIQGLQNGTSTNYVKSALLEVTDNKTIDRLSRLLLTTEYRNTNKENKRAIIDALAYGIYRITDGEYAAESYPASPTRRGELEVALKAGATMNRSGFRTDGRVLYGYGRFSGIVLEAKSITQTKLEYDIKGLKTAKEVVSYSLENTLLKSLEEQGITDFEEAGFSDEFIYDVLEDSKADINSVWDKINKNSVGTPEATNAIIKWLAPNNQNIKTIKDVEEVTKSNGLAYGKIVRQQTLKTNPDYDINKKHSYDKLQDRVTSLMLKSKKNAEILSKDIEKTTDLLDKTTNETINRYIIEKDFDYSFKAINDLYKRIASQYGLDSSRAQELIIQQTSDGDEINIAEQESKYGVEESPEAKLIREEEQAEDKRTLLDKTKESVNNFKNDLKEWLTTDQQKIDDRKNNEALKLKKSLDELSKSELKDDPEIASTINDMRTGKFLKDIVQETMTDENAFSIKNKIGRNTATLKTIFGDNYLKESGLSDILPKTKQNYKRDINKEISSLKDTDLTKEQQKLVDKDLSTLTTPNDFENHLARLKELSLQKSDKNIPVVSATVAPYLFNPVDSKTFKQAKNKIDKHFKETANRIAKNLSLDLVGVDNNLGGYTMDDTQPEYAGKVVDEISYTFNFKTTDTYKVDMFAMIMGDIGYENQQAVISSNYVPADSMEADGVEHAITVKSNKDVFEIIKELGISDYTFNLDTKTIKILEFDWSDEELILTNLLKLQEKLGDNVYEITTSKIQSRYLDRATRTRSYETWIKTGKISDKNGVFRNLTNQEIALLKEGYAQLTKTIEQADISVETETISVKKPSTISKAILDRYKAATEGISEAQFFDETDKSYTTVGYAMIEENAAIFSAVNDDNYEQIRNELKSDTSFYADQALLIFDLYTLEMVGKFSLETQNKIKAYNRRELTKSAQKLALQSRRVANRKPITHTLKQFLREGYKVTISDEQIQKYDKKLKEKDKYISELSEQIKTLEQRIKDSENELERQMLLKEVKEVSDHKLTIEAGTNEDIADWIVTHAETVEQATNIQTDLLKTALNAAEKAEAENKNVGYFFYNKDGTPKPFPKIREFIANSLRKLKSFRMWAMTSSPVTWVRNWVGNQGMRALDGATNAMERFISKRFGFDGSQMKYNETRAGKEVYNHIANTNKNFILNLIRGEGKKYDETGEKAADIKRQLRAKEYESANAFRKACLKAQDLNDWGLSEGFLGDTPVVFNSICKNMGNLVASNTEFLLQGISNELNSLKSRTRTTSDNRLTVLEKAIKTKDPKDIFDALSKEETTRLFDQAKQMSFQQYFKNQNNFNKWLANLAYKNPILGEIASWIMPFPKVAANILSMAYRYSPLGYIRALVQWSQAKQITAEGYKGRSTGFEQAEMVRAVSEASVGTVLMIAGAIAAALGWVDIDEDDYLGPCFNFGDVRIGLSQLAPSMTTFSTAAAVVWAWKNNKSGVSEALGVLYDNTLLGNVENIFRYSSPEQYMENLSISYLSQYIPSLLKLINKAVLKSPQKDKTGPYFSKLIKTLGSYVPGISKLVPDKIDPYTGKKVYASGSDNWFLNFIYGVSPIDIKYTETSEIASEAKRVGAETTGLSGSFKINGTTYKTTNKEKEKLAKYRAEYINSRFKSIVSGKEKITVENNKGKRITTTYDKLTESQKSNVLKRLYSEATEITKIKYWIDSGNTYVTANKDEYNKYKKELGSSIKYRQNWSKSKFVEG